THADSLSEQWFDLRLVSTTRLVLAATALLVILIEPTGSDRYLKLTYVILALYTIYSAVIFGLSIRHSALIPAQYMHWFDMVWFLGLISLSSGTNSIFFNVFF